MSVVSRYCGRKKKHRVPKNRAAQSYRNSLNYIEHQQVKFIKRQLINNGGAVCGICGKPITDMKDCTIDHIKPRAKGGTTTIENCQLAHRECNLKKGDAYGSI